MNTPANIDCSAGAQAFFDAYTAHDVERMIGLCSEGALLRYVPLGKLGEGPVRTTGRKIWSALISFLPDLTVNVRSLACDARTACAEIDIVDERRGFRLPHVFLLRMDASGRIAEVTAYWDNLNLAFQSFKALAGSLGNLRAALRTAR